MAKTSELALLRTLESRVRRLFATADGYPVLDAAQMMPNRDARVRIKSLRAGDLKDLRTTLCRLDRSPRA